MIRPRIVLSATAAAFLLLAACQKKTEEVPLNSFPEAGVFDVTRALQSLTVRGIENVPNEITLVDGKWEDAESHKRVWLVRAFGIVGPVRQHREGDLVAMLGASYGGTGSIDHLALVTVNIKDRTLSNVATVAIGDRVQVRDARVAKDGRIVLSVVQAGKDDAMCCPGETAERIWVFKDRKLKEVPSSKTHGRLSLADLEGTWWFRYWDWDEEGAGPTIQIRADAVSGSAGCSHFRARVIAGIMPGYLDFTDVTAGDKVCGAPGDSVQARFLPLLKGVTRFSFVATELALTYRVGDKMGTMVFERSHPVPID